MSETSKLREAILLEENVKLARELAAAKLRIAELEREDEINKAVMEGIREADKSKSPCEHFARFAHTEDGGRTITCTLCTVRELEENLRSIYVLVYSASTTGEGRIGAEALKSRVMLAIPNRFKGQVSDEELSCTLILVKASKES